MWTEEAGMWRLIGDPVLKGRIGRVVAPGAGTEKTGGPREDCEVDVADMPTVGTRSRSRSMSTGRAECRR